MKYKITVEHDNEKIEVESDYIIALYGYRGDDTLLNSTPIINGVTYEELTRSIALLGYIAIDNMNKHKIMEEIKEATNED